MNQIRIINKFKVGARPIFLGMTFSIISLILGMVTTLSTSELLSYNLKKNISSSDLNNKIMTCLSLWFMIILLFYFAYKVFLQKKYYTPGKSFAEFRPSDIIIANRYKNLMIIGAVTLPICVVRVVFAGKDFLKFEYIGLLLLSASAFFSGYYGRISKKIHSDVDYVAVETLRSAGLISREKVYGAYQNFDPSKISSIKQGSTVFGILSDALIILFYDGKQWSKVKRKYSEIEQIGISNYPDSTVIQILLHFANNVKYKLEFNLLLKISSEPMTFVRQFLEVLDSTAARSSVVQKNSRRRRFTEEKNESLEISIEENVFADKSAETKSRNIEIDECLTAELKEATIIKSSRSLEL